MIFTTPPRGTVTVLPEQHLTVAALFATSTNAALFTKSVDAGTANVGQTLDYQIDLSNVSETGPIHDQRSITGGHVLRSRFGESSS